MIQTLMIALFDRWNSIRYMDEVKLPLAERVALFRAWLDIAWPNGLLAEERQIVAEYYRQEAAALGEKEP